MGNATGTIPAIGPFKTSFYAPAKRKRSTRLFFPKQTTVMGGRCVKLVPCDVANRLEALLGK